MPIKKDPFKSDSRFTMEKNNKRSAGDGDGEFPLPPELIQHIQSFLNRKDAVRTTVLSKFWYNFWSKRPILDFDQRDFRHLGASDFKTKIMHKVERSDDFYLKIETFKLWMEPYHHHQPLAKESIVKAMKLGATDLKIELWTPLPCLVLPDEEARGSETLARLSVTGCAINLSKNGEVTCSKLRSLRSGVIIINGDMLRDLISRYPLLILKFSGRLEYEFHKLESLSLGNLRVIDPLFFPNLFSKFPCLKNLAIRYIYDCKNIRICSQSLECISVAEYNRAVTAVFDVPNIRKFHFVGSALSCLAFKTTCRDWESDIGIMCYQASASWLSSLRKLLTNFSLSKVSLSIHVKFPSNYTCDYTTAHEHIPVVESLMFMDHAPNDGLLDGLFMICRPKFVSQRCFARGDNGLLELLCKKFVDEASEHHCIPNPSMHGLEEVNVEHFDESLAEWRPLPWKTLLDASTDPENAHELRFRLRWGTETSAL